MSDGTKLVALLGEMKDGLDVVTAKVRDLTQKVKDNKYPTADGISYLEAKNLLLISYCQSIVYYLLRKAKGYPMNGHPLVRSLVEIRLFLEKIRPIDKKLEYQVQKFTRAASNAATDNIQPVENKTKETEDPLRYRPNPDLIDNNKSEQDAQGGRDGVYRPRKFAPTVMNEDKISKQEKQVMRREKEALRRGKQSDILKEFMDEVDDRPEEIKEFIASESREFSRYKANWEERAQQEEELFTRVPITRQEKKQQRHLLKSRDGLMGLTDGFYDDLRALPLEEGDNGEAPSSKGGRKTSKRKRKH